MTSVVNVKVAELRKNGFTSFREWQENPNHIYIGRNMSYYVKGAHKSKWANPYPVTKYGLEQSLVLYEKYLHQSGLIKNIHELQGKILGCWCHPQPCHGDILIKYANMN